MVNHDNEGFARKVESQTSQNKGVKNRLNLVKKLEKLKTSVTQSWMTVRFQVRISYLIASEPISNSIGKFKAFTYHLVASLQNYFWKSEGRKRVLAKYQFEIE